MKIDQAKYDQYDPAKYESENSTPSTQPSTNRNINSSLGINKAAQGVLAKINAIEAGLGVEGQAYPSPYGSPNLQQYHSEQVPGPKTKMEKSGDDQFYEGKKLPGVFKQQ